ncbi:MAG: antitoxin [Hyphomicrobium sp.]|nr:MAG: antitoxin [Hyphomicrobium sp.]
MYSFEGQSEPVQIATMLGLRNPGTFTPMKLASAVEAGIPAEAAKRAVHKLDPTGSFVDIHRIVPRSTLARRVAAKGRLDKDETSAVVRLLQVLLAAERLYHDRDEALDFLARPHALLEMKAPIEVAISTSVGADAVLDLIASAEAGTAV